MHFADIDSDLLDQHLPQFAPTEFLGRGGQKRVFKCTYEDQEWALMLILVSSEPDETLDGEESDFGRASDQAISRLRREVNIMRKCESPHLVKMGPIDITPLEIENLSILYFLEEYIDGDDLKSILAQGPLDPDEVITLAEHCTIAINSLWTSNPLQQIIHRDIKPANIMKRNDSGDFVVLDVGLAFDQLADSITNPGHIPGTARYITPDQLDLSKKRQMDFRTDMFALGLTLYEASTGHHPFHSLGMSTNELFRSILSTKPKPVRDLRDDIPEELESIIMKLLAKKPHLRYRTCDMLLEALNEARKGQHQ